MISDEVLVNGGMVSSFVFQTVVRETKMKLHLPRLIFHESKYNEWKGEKAVSKKIPDP